MSQIAIIPAEEAIKVMERISKNEICGKCLTETFITDTLEYYCKKTCEDKKSKHIICNCGHVDLWIDETCPCEIIW